jgi:hypothetical protein
LGLLGCDLEGWFPLAILRSQWGVERESGEVGTGLLAESRKVCQKWVQNSSNQVQITWKICWFITVYRREMSERIHIQTLRVDDEVPQACSGEASQGFGNVVGGGNGFSLSCINLSYNSVWREPEEGLNAEELLEHGNPDWSLMSSPKVRASEYEEPPLPMYSPLKDYQRTYLENDDDDCASVPPKENVHPAQGYSKLVSLHVTCDRKASVLTAVCDTAGFDSSLCANASANACCKLGLTTERSRQPHPMPEAIHSVKISIGHFNSVECAQSVPTPLAWKQEAKDGLKTEEGKSTQSRHCCSCKKSRCLKLYCECFANGGYCHGCNCVDCHNRAHFQEEIRQAKQTIGEKNPVAFKRRMCEDNDERAPISCNCSKSGCLKKYCECYKNGLKCGSSCNCVSCSNTTALRTISYRRFEKNHLKTRHSALHHLP